MSPVAAAAAEAELPVPSSGLSVGDERAVARGDGADPVLSPAAIPSKSRGAAPVLLGGLHLFRWCFAAGLASTLAAVLCGFVVLGATMQVIDSHPFWHGIAEKSPALRSIHSDIDRWFDSAVISRNSPKQGAALRLGNSSGVVRALESARGPIHRVLSGRVITGTVGIVTGRDPVPVESISSINEAVHEQLGIAIVREVCQAGERDGAMCTAGKLVMRQRSTRH